MTKSQEEYKIPFSKMEDGSIDNWRNEKLEKSKLHYVKTSEKLRIPYPHVSNQREFFMRYKITVLIAIVSMVGLLLFSTVIIWTSLQSANDFSSLEIGTIVEDKSTRNEEIFDNAKNPSLEPRRMIYHQINYLQAPRKLEKREIRKIQKRETFPTELSINDDNIVMNNRIRLRRVETGKKIAREMETIPDAANLFPEINNENDETSRNNEKREIERREKMTTCKRNTEHCKSVVKSMQSLVKSTGDNVDNLSQLLKQIKVSENKDNTDPQKFEAFLQCIECNKIANADDRIVFDDSSKDDEDGEERMIYHHPLYENRNSQLKNMSSIINLLEGTNFETDQKPESTKIDETSLLTSENSSLTTEPIKIDPPVKKTVQVTTSHKTTDGVDVTQIIKNTTIMRPHVKEGSEKDSSKIEVPSSSRPEIEASTMPSMTFDSLKNLHDRPIQEFKNPINTPTGPSAINNSPRFGDTSSGWGETTRSQAMMEVPSADGTMPQFRQNYYQDMGQEDGPMRASFDPRIMMNTQNQNQATKDIYEGNPMILPTAENSKTSQQVQYTPPMWMPYPVCFFGSPPSGQSFGPFKPSMPGNGFPVSSSGSGSGYPFPGNQFPQGGFRPPGQTMAHVYGPPQFNQQQSGQFRPGTQFQYGNQQDYQQSHRVGPTGPGIQNFWPNFGNTPTGPGQNNRGPYYCTYMPGPTFQFPTIPGVSEFHRSAYESGEHAQDRDRTYPYSEPTWNMQDTNYPEYPRECDHQSLRCAEGSRCIPKKLWCDGKVDCPDASDEIKCSCRARVNKERICDSYFDCPRGEDELGCFGCPMNSFSCQDWVGNHRRGNCVPLSQRCDGLRQCPNGKDEMDCSMLTQLNMENQDIFAVGYTSGYLHKNWQGRWYPVCTQTESWAIDACTAETGSQVRERPRIQTESIPSGHYQLPFIRQEDNGQIRVVPTCYDKAIFVRCPEIECGTRVLSDQDNSPYYRQDDWILGSPKNSTTNGTGNGVDEISNGIENISQNVDKVFDDKKLLGTDDINQEIVSSDSRVVGGRASQPKAWPFLVAIYKDGYFHCGGAIIDEEWILTAAHCVDGFPNHYIEVQAGLLRRFSFSPMAQTRRVVYIKMHPNYENKIMKNDLALMKLNEPLLFNRWIRAACLPKSYSTDPYWRNGPYPDSTCVTIGWGAITELGPDPDHLREVEVPILRECKRPEDRNEAEICAGFPQGGRDACQGDSGGPLMCSYPNSDNRWYVAGIVSHGEGCARPNEPGAYTKVSHFVDWIDEIMSTRYSMGPKPLGICPGFSCAGGLGRCLPSSKRCDRTADCLDAEDEINCGYHKGFSLFRGGNSSNDHSDFVKQSNPDYDNDVGTMNENSTKTEISNDTNYGRFPSDLPMDYNENSVNLEDSTPNPSVILIKETDDILTNFTNSQVPNVTTIKPETTTIHSDERFVMQRFVCTRLTQSLPIDKRCNRIIDCEDGTDEDNCTCKDNLANLYPKAICDGHVDCYDGTDEENCGFCKDDEFVCSRSGTCVPRSKVCDRLIDCPNMEDELDCFILTNGEYVITDLDKRPHLNLEGVVTQWKNGSWRPACQNFNATIQTRLSHEFCHYFGFGAAENVEYIPVRDSPIEIIESTRDNVIPYEYPPLYNDPEDDEKTCRGLYVQCKPILSANASHLIVANPENEDLSYLWPWQASIFVNGRYHCPAILLEYSWLLATSRCVENLDLRGNYTMAMVGMAPTYRYVDSPYQQLTPIDSIKILQKLDAALLHLEHPVNTTRYVQPIFVQKRIFPASRRDMCIATGVDKKYRTETTFLQPVPECASCHRCYQNATYEECRNKTSSNWSGTIVCRGSGNWYPAAIFHEKDILCGFQSVQTVTSIDYGNAHFTEIMNDELTPIGGPICDGHRCPLGNCVPWNKICDGIDDCRDGSDENNQNYCDDKRKNCEATNGINCECSKSELRCANGQCVPKEAFCDYKADCDDRSDETPECTCADYLKLTAPERLCNNVRDCLDKSDERSEHCSCKDASFKCPSVNGTKICISHDFVCDGDRDCPNGEDENNCRIIKGALKDPPGTGEVLRRSYGVWHSECFPTPIATTQEVSDVCRTMNYDYGMALNFEGDENPYGPALIPERDDFYMIRLNEKAWVTMRRSRPLVSIVKAQETCHRNTSLMDSEVVTGRDVNVPLPLRLSIDLQEGQDYYAKYEQQTRSLARLCPADVGRRRFAFNGSDPIL